MLKHAKMSTSSLPPVKSKLGNWREVQLKEVAKTNYQNIDSDYPYKIIQYLDTGSITRGKIECFQQYTISEAPSRAKRLVKNGDIVYSNVRPIQRHYGFIKNPPNNLVVSTGFSVIKTDQSKADPLFIYYLLSSNNIVEELDAIAEGATSAYPSIRPSDIENLEIILPSLSEQKAIAKVLSSLDDKIDLLYRQNKTLEDMAQTLFMKWFTHTGVEDNKETETWEEIRLSDLANHKKVNIKPSNNPETYYYHYSIPSFDNSKTPIKELGKDIKSNKYKVFERSILVSKLNPRFPRVWPIFKEVDNNAVCSTEFQVVQPKNDKAFGFIYCFLKSKWVTDKLISSASGTSGSHQRVRPEDVFNLPLGNPTNKILERFFSTTNDYWERIFNNKTQIYTLENMRDTLLPKLMSGKVRVKF